MIIKNIEREITPVSHSDYFIILYHENAEFDFPFHYHPECELNLVLNSSGKRIVGDSIENYAHFDLVLVGSNTPHKWTGNSENKNCKVITIQFSPDIFPSTLLDKNLMSPIKLLLENSDKGIVFSKETINNIKTKIIELSNMHGFDSILAFQSIIFDLALSRNQKLLSSRSFLDEVDKPYSRRIKKVIDYVNKNYTENIKLIDVAELVAMTETAFSHFFKKRTSKSFSDYLIDIRIGHASKELLETNNSITEICYNCGFNNISNFNRIFKKKKGFAPKEFRNIRQDIIKF